MANKTLIEDALNLIRFSPPLGRGSFSTVDECYSDDELRKEIEETIEQYGCKTAQDVFEKFLEIENVRQSVERDIRGEIF